MNGNYLFDSWDLGYHPISFDGGKGKVQWVSEGSFMGVKGIWEVNQTT